MPYRSRNISGSPPLVRERLRQLPRRYHSYRITPARAGKTGTPEQPRVSNWDHPRSCGKDPACPSAGFREAGSPPLVRERRFFCVICRCGRGITPARAGKTSSARRFSISAWDHPRSCGKDPIYRYCLFPGLGSPPLVRERLGHVVYVFIAAGITPARAGKTVAAIRSFFM